MTHEVPRGDCDAHEAAFIEELPSNIDRLDLPVLAEPATADVSQESAETEIEEEFVPLWGRIETDPAPVRQAQTHVPPELVHRVIAADDPQYPPRIHIRLGDDGNDEQPKAAGEMQQPAEISVDEDENTGDDLGDESNEQPDNAEVFLPAASDSDGSLAPDDVESPRGVEPGAAQNDISPEEDEGNIEVPRTEDSGDTEPPVTDGTSEDQQPEEGHIQIARWPHHTAEVKTEKSLQTDELLKILQQPGINYEPGLGGEGQEKEPINLEYRETERELVRNFDKLVDRQNVADIAVAHEVERPDGRRELQEIQDLDRFKLTPITSSDASDSSLSAAGITAPRQDIRVTYDGTSSHQPYIDAAQAIGLTYEDDRGNKWLVAVASAGVDKQNRLKIVQFQDVSGVHLPSRPKRADVVEKAKAVGADERQQEVAYQYARQEFKDKLKWYMNSPLQKGMAWKETLVAAWERVAIEIGAEAAVIQSNENSFWSTVRNARRRTYDETANNLGYDFDEEVSRNWIKPL